jgi:branched-chain amino acid transport system substrate-binding protein
MTTRRIFLAATAMALLASGPLAAQDKEPIRIGSITSNTGGLASLGLAERDGVLLAQKVINARGGIDGHPLEVIVTDDASNPDAAVSRINELIHSQKVKAVVGPTGIAQTVAIGALTQREQVPVMAFTGLGLPVEKERTCVFHLTPAQALNARALLSYVRDNGGKKVSVLHDSGYGQVIWGAMKDMGEEFGVEFIAVGDGRHRPGRQDQGFGARHRDRPVVDRHRRAQSAPGRRHAADRLGARHRAL